MDDPVPSRAHSSSANRSAPTSLVAGGLAFALTAIGLIPGGQVLQGLWLVSLVLSLAAVALAFVGITVARAGSGRLWLSLVAMAANVAVLGWLIVLAATRF